VLSDFHMILKVLSMLLLVDMYAIAYMVIRVLGATSRVETQHYFVLARALGVLFVVLCCLMMATEIINN
jgi:hypothetical protein